MAYAVSVCICTRNRPDDLQKAIESIYKSSSPPHEVIVSDDSGNDLTYEMVRESFPQVKYVKGPKQGLCANRNTALKNVTGTHVVFIDDDVVMDSNFLSTIQAFGQVSRADGARLIITGVEVKNGQVVYPHDQDFLGFQRVEYHRGDPIRTVVINSTLFPASVFQELQFDEQLVYGYDEVDFTTRAVRCGYTILLCEAARNWHFPSPINRDYYSPHLEASRLYVTFKRYLYTERSPFKALAFSVVATAHTLSHAIQSKRMLGVWQGLRTIANAARCISQMNRRAPSSASVE